VNHVLKVIKLESGTTVRKGYYVISRETSTKILLEIHKA
jgi:hypothetical protein